MKSIIPHTHCQQCSTLISMFNHEETICNDCRNAPVELDEDYINQLNNSSKHPEQVMFTEQEQRRIRKVVMETANSDLRAAYGLVRRLIHAATDEGQFLKAAYLLDLRRDIIGEEVPT